MCLIFGAVPSGDVGEMLVDRGVAAVRGWSTSIITCKKLQDWDTCSNAPIIDRISDEKIVDWKGSTV